MLYLVSEKGQRTIKVGYTGRTASKRISEYATHSTVTQFIDWMEGSEEDEKNWHDYMYAMGFSLVDPDRERSEWYYMPDYIDKRKLMKGGFEYLEATVSAHWHSVIENL